ncbi:glycosyltransferase family 2 protein [Vibrio parahaemolyticus]|nr:glycosyltransferase family 2 protein [Vibrio parahaemolyticus]
MSKPTLAVALIVKNEEKHLKACLDTVKGWVDEIVILDSGSTDRTEEIARQYTDKFYTNLDWPGFGKQRQLAQQYVTADYILWLDADEQVTPELKASILQAVSADKSNVLYKLNRLSSAFGKFIYHSGWSPDWIVRLYRTEYTHYNDSLVHEKVDEKSYQTEKLDGRLHHYTYEHLHHYINKTTGYLKAWTDEREGKKKSGLTTAIVHALASFLKMYILKRGFLDGKHGFILAWLSMHSTFVKYIDLYLREQAKKS